MNEPIIRPCRPDDGDAVVEIANLGWEGINAHLGEALGAELFGMIYGDPCTRKGEEMRHHLERDRGAILVSEVDGRVAGFVMYSVDGEKKLGTVGNNAVHPDCRGRGLARRMYEAVFDIFRREGMKYAAVLTGLDAGHAAARRAYEKAGFDRRVESVKYYKKL